MNSSDENSSSDESLPAAKRPRTDTYGASSTTSHGSEALESDDDSSGNPNPDNYATGDKINLKYNEPSNERTQRLSRSSLSENCSSPNDQYDEYRMPCTKFRENDSEDASGSETTAPSKENAFYNRTNDDFKEIDTVYPSQYSVASKKMMNNMGYKPGRGLGKFEHGRVDPVEASKQKGRRGLGLPESTVGDVSKDLDWSPEESPPEAKENIFWLPERVEDPLSSDDLENCLKKGPKKEIIDDETNFIEPIILQRLLTSKSRFDKLQDEDMKNARFCSNPYETIGSNIFLNRAAVKMANMDAVLNFAFTRPRGRNGKEIVGEKDLLYFADVCAGPGGFSEYVLYRKGWRAKGFGFTLKKEKDFKLSDFIAGSPETFNPYYGEKKDGDIYDPGNLQSLKKFILKQTDDTGVHFLMADGGFSVEGKENIQEILSKRLYLCQCLAALMVVRTEGNFVVKLFDVFTTFSVGLIYIMYKSFEKVCIHKPVTSRPANSERYLICLRKKPGTEAAEQHLTLANRIFDKSDKYTEVTELIPLSVLKADTEFYDYIYKSNCLIAENQIRNLSKIAAFSKDKNLTEKSQTEMRKECLKLWNLPDEMRTQIRHRNAEDTLTYICNNVKRASILDSYSNFSFKNLLKKQPQYIENKTDIDVFKNVYNWKYTILSSEKGSPNLKIFIGCGGKKVYYLTGNSWESAASLHVTFPANTLIYGEIVKEFSREGSGQMYSKALHVIDAMMLGGVDISHESISERNKQCALFCTALEKCNDDSNGPILPIRHKKYYDMETFPTNINDIEYRVSKKFNKTLTVNIPRRSDMFYIVGSLLFIKEVKDKWQALMSKTYKTKYYFEKGPDGNSESVYDLPKAGQLDMLSAYSSRVMWPWGEAANQIFQGNTNSCISRVDMENYINKT